MSIHGILAVLLGSTALGGYAPLTLLRAQRYYLTGLGSGAVSLHHNSLNIVDAIPSGQFLAGELINHSILAESVFRIGWVTQGIILGFMGMMPTEATLHSAIQETELDGYGYLYGEGYGE